MVLDYECVDDVATVALDRPDRMNALTDELAREIREALSRGADEGQVIVLTGRGRGFCAGADLDDPLIGGDQAIEELRDQLQLVQDITMGIRRLPVPVIARVNGPAMGAGCDLALACDFRIAAESALFCESFVNVGVISGDGGAYLLPRLVGEQTAKEMALLGREIDGREAEEIGLVNRTVPDENLDDAVADLVAELLDLPPLAIGQNKDLINRSLESTIDEAMTDALYRMWVCLQSEYFDEASKRFAEGH